MIVAIDGPAGAGKSTISRRVADALGFRMINTGSMYRCVALAAIQAGVDLNDAAAVNAVAASLDIRFDASDRVLLNGDDVTEAIRTSDVAAGSSLVSVHGEVREAMVALQRQTGALADSVLEGRDIGTVVFPDAEVKVFLTASAAERATRRCADLEAAGEPAEFGTILAAIEARDHRDTTRLHSPLVAAEDAVRVDTTGLGLDAVVERVLALVRDAANRSQNAV